MFFLFLILPQVFCELWPPPTYSGVGVNKQYVAVVALDIPALAAPGLQTSLQLQDGICEISLCINFLAQPANDTLQWPLLCSQYIQFTASAVVNIPIRPGQHHFILFLNSITSSPTCTYDLTLAGPQCPTDQYGRQCNVQLSTLPMNITLGPSETTSFAISTSGGSVAGFTVTPSSSVLLYQREGTIPWLPDVYDKNYTLDDQAQIVLQNPRNSPLSQLSTMFTIGNVNLDPINVGIQTPTVVECPPGSSGDSCQYQTQIFSVTSSYVVTPSAFGTQQWFLGYLNVSSPNFWSVGITPFNGQRTPAIYVRLGNIPTETQFDACHNGTTDKTRWYITGPLMSTTSLWYVGFFVPKGAVMGEFGLWFNSSCPNQCNGHGSCSNNICSCGGGFSGWDCSQHENESSSGVTESDIGLYIGIGISVGVALIGALIYLRYRRSGRKRSNSYDYLRKYDDAANEAKNYLTVGTL